MIEKTFSTSILTMQCLLLVHLMDEVGVAGIVHTKWMFFFEQFMKFLKGFFCQKTRPKGSIAKRWIVQESCIWIFECLGSIDLFMTQLWSNKDDDILAGKVRQGKGL